jgi:hypothetical protein
MTRDLPKPAVVAVLWAWLALLLVTHFGARSPYSYGWAMFGEKSERLLGAVVNPDALPMYAVTLFFYEAADVDWSEAQNLRLPFHAFSTSIVAGLTRSYLLANCIANFVFAALVALAAVNLAERFRLRRSAVLVALLTLFTLPMYVEYLGQPMQYVAGPAVSFLVVLAIIALNERDARNPWIAGLATSLLTLNYDPYVFLVAVVAYFLFISRFESFCHYVYYGVASAVPGLAWGQFLEHSSRGTMSRHLNTTFVQPVVDAWSDFFQRPLHNALQPFVSAHIGIHVAVRQLLSMIHWPLLVVCVYLLIRLRPSIRVRSLWLAALLPCAFVVEQMGAAPWDWELNPRRAIPVVLAFGIAWCYLTDRLWVVRRWRIAFIALLVFHAWLCMGDTFGRYTVPTYLHSGQSVRDAPQNAMQFKEQRLRPQSMPALMRDDRIVWHDLSRARLPRSRALLFALSQLFNLAFLCGVFWLTGRAGILPRWGWWVCAGVWVVSLARFL